MRRAITGSSTAVLHLLRRSRMMALIRSLHTIMIPPHCCFYYCSDPRLRQRLFPEKSLALVIRHNKLCARVDLEETLTQLEFSFPFIFSIFLTVPGSLCFISLCLYFSLEPASHHRLESLLRSIQLSRVVVWGRG